MPPSNYGDRVVLRYVLTVLTLVVVLFTRSVYACEPCAQKAREERQAAAAARAQAKQLGASGTSLSGSNPPTMADTYVMEAQAYEAGAKQLDAAYQQCMSGVKNQCGGGSGSGASGAAAAAPSQSDQIGSALSALRNYAASDVQGRTAALRAVNAELARLARSSGSAEANKAARSIGSTSLEDQGADDGAAAPGPADGTLAPSQLESLRNAPTRMGTSSTFAPGQPNVVPYDGPPVQEISFDSPSLNTLVPVDAGPATPEQMLNDMQQVAAAPDDPPPTSVLGVAVAGPNDAPAAAPGAVADSGQGGDGFHLPAGTVQDADALAHAGLKWGIANEPDAAGLVGEVKSAYAPLKEANDAATLNNGNGMVAAGNELTAPMSAENREDMRTGVHLSAGASDRIDRGLQEKGESEATDNEEFLKNVEGGDPDLLRAYLPAPITKVLELRDRANETLKSAGETGEYILSRAQTYYQAAKDARTYVRGEVRSGAAAVVSYVQDLWGSTGSQ